MRIGYARVSTQDQNLNRQLGQLRQDGCERIYEEKGSGAKSDRPELRRLLDALREGDVVVVAELSRLSRSVRDLFEIVGQIHEAVAEIKSLKEPWLDTTTPQGRLLFTFFSGISEFERELIRQRTIEGISAARARGRLGGHPPLDSKRVDLALKMYDSRACTIADITKATGVSKSALYRYLQDRKNREKKPQN
jgi:DNA invertase Pin-like site-specific DNA recombinase